MARRRRTIAALIGVALITWFVFSSQSRPGKSRLSTPDYFNNARRFPLPQPESSRISSKQAPPLPADKSKLKAFQNRYYEGKIQLYSLSYTLQAAAARGGQKDRNDNVVFVAANGRSMSLLLPIACEMTRWRRNHVHFVFIGRTNTPILDILRANGIGDECSVFWHDARPDYATYSTDLRMEVTALEVLKHVQASIHPQALFLDDSGAEEAWMTKSTLTQTRTYGIPLIPLPASADKSLMWITRLDAGALRAWHQDGIHILIHTPPRVSGSLLRLLTSLQAANYAGITPPSLTIELPAEDDKTLSTFLSTFTWPPGAPPGQNRAFTVRHRIQPLSEDPLASCSSRFIESFYPADPPNDHVLLLSPSAELSPLYLHHLRYHLLNYRHSSYTLGETDTTLFGLALTPLNTTGTAKLSSERRAERASTDNGDSSPFNNPPLLSQNPDTHAALYFGPFWAEFHDFMTHRLRFSPEIIHDRQSPAWKSYLLELVRARGSLMLHPGLNSPDALVKLHDEYAPYEPGDTEPAFGKEQRKAVEGLQKLDPGQGPIAVQVADYPGTVAPGSEGSRVVEGGNLLQHLPGDGDLGELDGLPVLGWQGKEISRLGLEAEAVAFAKEFAGSVGKCDGEGVRRVRTGGAGDLFCTERARADGAKKG